MSYGNLILEDGGLPIPQSIDRSTQACVPLYSENGALRVTNADIPEDGITQIKIMALDGTPVAVSNTAVPVTVTNEPLGIQEFNGERWVSSARGFNAKILENSLISGPYLESDDVWNASHRNGIIFANVTNLGTGKTYTIDILIKVNNEYKSYKTLTGSWGDGQNIITFGLDDIDNKFLIPAEFKIRFSYSNSSIATFVVTLQLV